jgi:hypothetical protein
VIVTGAPATGAPLVSVTLPVMFPRSDCAKAQPARARKI